MLYNIFIILYTYINQEKIIGIMKNVLSISHNKAMGYLLSTILTDSFHPLIVEDVFHGMNVLNYKQDISLIIIDIDYQTKESIDFILHLNSSKLYNKPIIVLSSIQNQQANEFDIEAFVYHYFIKPFNPIELVNIINELFTSLKTDTSSPN